MHIKTHFTQRTLSMFWIVTVLCCGQAYAQTFFDFTVPADAAPADFLTLTAFSTPTGSGPNRKTIARILTPTPVAGVMFEITPPAGKTAAQITVDGAIGGIEVSGTGAAVADLVRAEVISDAPDNAPVATGFALIRVTIQYNANFDFGGAAETWNLKAKEMTTARRYRGFVGTGVDNPDTPADDIDVLVTRPRMTIKESKWHFGEGQEGLSSSALCGDVRDSNTSESAENPPRIHCQDF